MGITIIVLSVQPTLAYTSTSHNAEETPSYVVFMPLITLNYAPPSPTLLPNDPYYTSQWALDRTNAPRAWRESDSSLGKGVLIAVLDTGADFEHVDLTAKLRSDIDKDFVNDDDEAQDDHGHGTHVAGIAAAATNNEEGVVGLGWDAEVLPLKVLDKNGGGSLAKLVNAVYYATDQGANIINMSLATDADYNLQCSQFPALLEALQYAYEHDVLVVVAAGNDNDDAGKVVPANCPYVLTVAATDSSDTRSYFSNYGSVIDIAAPGQNIYSTKLGNKYGTKRGTSMAAPFVAGLASLVWAKFPEYTPDQVSDTILNNAIDLGEVGRDTRYGCGRIDALAAVAHGITGDTVCRTDALSAADHSVGNIPGQAFVLTPETPPRHNVSAETFVAGHLIVRLNLDRTQDTLMSEYNIETLQTLANDIVLVRVPLGAEWDTAQKLMVEGVIEYAQPDYRVFAQ
ncbi:MAG: peptidase S8 [Anaerolineae bacterium]|nr:peptidase S8 [Anaerolineae bacterium]